MELIVAIARSIGYALNGLFFVFRSQKNFRIHLFAAALVLAAAVFLNFSRVEWVLTVLTVGLVLLAELLNTALEFAMNLLESRDHPVVRHAKDIAAGAVLTAVVASVVCGLLLFGPPLCKIWRGR